MAVSEALERQVGPETAFSEALGRQVGPGTATSEAFRRQVCPGTAVLGTFERGVGSGPAEAGNGGFGKLALDGMASSWLGAGGTGFGRLWGHVRESLNDEKKLKKNPVFPRSEAPNGNI